MAKKAKKKYRIAKDSMGEMKIPADALYGASTQRAVENFPVSGIGLGRAYIEALGQIKSSAAVANGKLKILPAAVSKAVSEAAIAVRDGKYDKEFVCDIYQTGSGTSTNMNANEVIATLATKALKKKGRKTAVHPNDHVNNGQSSNDVIPTAIHVAAVLQLTRHLKPELKALEKELTKKARAYAKVYKIGRTHLQDATPMTLGQEFSGYANQIKKGQERIDRVLPALRELAIGGTAVGTGINAHPKFATELIRDMNKTLGEKFVEAENHFEAQAAKDACVEASGALKTIAVSLMKIANDIRWLGCGPRVGFAEIKLPATQPGSSIMPGKVNPVIPESVTQVAAQVIGNDSAITVGAQAGNFELNVMMPMIAHNLLESIRLLANVSAIFRTKCIEGIEADRDVCKGTIEKSLMLGTALVPVIGYDAAAALAKQAYAEGKTIRELAKEKKLMSDKELNEALDVRNLI